MEKHSTIHELYHSAFPANERRPWAEMELLEMNEKRFTIKSISRDGTFCGFITSWNFDDFVYVEHFAVADALRGKVSEAKLSKTYAAQPNALLFSKWKHLKPPKP